MIKKLYINEYIRKARSLIQKMMLFDVCKDEHCDDIIHFYIMGNRQYIYKISICIDKQPILIKCNCPDFTYKNVDFLYCKHIYWLGFSIFLKEPDNWDIELISNYYEEFNSIKRRKNYIGRNDNCPICLEIIDYENQNTFCCKESCGNAVHSQCWLSFYVVAYNHNCVCCRGKTMPRIIN